MAASIYFNREASQKVENTTLQTNSRGALISWREHLFPGGSTYLIVNKYWGSSYFAVNDTVQ